MNYMSMVVPFFLGTLFFYFIIFVIDHFKDKHQESKMINSHIRNWFLYAVVEAEKQFGPKMGKIKKSAVYDAFIQRFPNMKFISEDQFDKLIDDSLSFLHQLMEGNQKISNYIDDDNKLTSLF